MGSPTGFPPEAGGLPDPAGFDALAQRVVSGAPAIISPDPYAPGNEKRYKEVLNELKKEALDNRWVFERLWWRHILYLLGRQWIYYDKKRGQWLDKRMAKWVPRPVTNKISEAHESILAMFSSVKLGVTSGPVGHDSADVATAEVADKLAPFIHDSHEMDRVMRTHDWWLTCTGNAFLHTYWATSESKNVIVPNEQCDFCKAIFKPEELANQTTCPTCGSQTFVTAMDEQTGQPIGQPVVEGHGVTVALSPFEMLLPPGFNEFKTSPYCIQTRWRPKQY
jgi:predicted RNA-binding Zn-ribbon protein involved in translation (DUF1610 family)